MNITVITYSSLQGATGGAFLSTRIEAALREVCSRVHVVRVPSLAEVREAAGNTAAARAVACGVLMGDDPRAMCAASAVRAALATDPPDVIVLDSTLLGGMAKRMRLEWPRARIVAIAHNNEARYARLGVSLGDVSKLPFVRVAPAVERHIVEECDAVICFSDRNEAYFKSLGARQTHRLWVPVTGGIGCRIGHEPPQFDLLMVGSRNRFNEAALSGLLRWIGHNGSVTLLVAGRLADCAQSSRLVTCHGRYENPKEVYALAHAAINPINRGEGVKIKTFEALEHGVPVIGFPEAFEGVAPNAFGGMCHRIRDLNQVPAVLQYTRASGGHRESDKGPHAWRRFVADLRVALC
jgi:hypothetical protein